MELATRRVHFAGCTPNPDEFWMKQLARSLTVADEGFLLGKRYLLMDRDTSSSPPFVACSPTPALGAVTLGELAERLPVPGLGGGQQAVAAQRVRRGRVQGHEFDSAVLAGALELDAAEVEERLQALDYVHGLVRLVREHEFPDRTLTQRYAFVHVLYQQALYTGLSPSRLVSSPSASWRLLASPPLVT